jgi:hypothetical protein
MWSETKQVGSINYWTGDVVLVKEYVPKVRFWDELLMSLSLKSAESNVVSCEYEVSTLGRETVTEHRAMAWSLIGDLSLAGRRRKR